MNAIHIYSLKEKEQGIRSSNFCMASHLKHNFIELEGTNSYQVHFFSSRNASSFKIKYMFNPKYMGYEIQIIDFVLNRWRHVSHLIHT